MGTNNNKKQDSIIKLQCPICNFEQSAPEKYKNKIIKCQKCQKKFIAISEKKTPQKIPNIVKKEICENCNRQIGKIEQAYPYKGRIVCKQCNQILKDDIIGYKMPMAEQTDAPTKNQIEFAKRLELEITDDITKWELSDLIDDAVKKRDEKPSVQIIEKTGKIYKGIMLIGLLIFVVGILITMNSYSLQSGLPLIIIGGSIFIIGKTFAWWYHG